MIKVYWLYKEATDSVFTDGYVGVTKNEKVRFAQHRKRFGEFKFEILFSGTKEQCLAVEFQLRPVPGIGWNRACGGMEGYRLGHCEETRKIIKEKRAKQIAPRLGMKHKEEAKIRISNSNLGKKRSAEAVANMKASKQCISAETRAKISAASLGRKHKPEAKAKVTAALLGRIVSQETRAKIRASLTGRKYSKERCENMSIGKRKNFYFDPSQVIILSETVAIADAEAEQIKAKEGV